MRHNSLSIFGHSFSYNNLRRLSECFTVPFYQYYGFDNANDEKRVRPLQRDLGFDNAIEVCALSNVLTRNEANTR